MPKAKTKKANPEIKICEAALRLIARQGWDRLKLDDVARVAKIPPAQLRKSFTDKNELLPGIIRLIDSQMLAAAGKPDSKATPHDRLFEILMVRLDVLQANRRAILSIMDSARRDPRIVKKLLPAETASMRVILGFTEPKSGGLPEPFVIAGLLGIYGLTLCAWRKDSSPDMAKTMAALDRYLRRAASISDILFRRGTAL